MPPPVIHPVPIEIPMPSPNAAHWGVECGQCKVIVVGLASLSDAIKACTDHVHAAPNAERDAIYAKTFPDLATDAVAARDRTRFDVLIAAAEADLEHGGT